MKSKKIYDPIHKYMSFEPLLLKVIDTVEFQRLKNIKQLGLAYNVFSGASHNRFEHSLGVAHLSGLLLENLQQKQPELNITTEQITYVKLAGLVHDIGHSCFSHFFDNYFLKNKFKDSKEIEHEYRSKLIFEFIVKKYKLEISDDNIDFVKNLINPNKNNHEFIYQIIANNKTGIDCDKFDYLLRDTYNLGLPYTFECNRFIENAKVIDNDICFSDKLIFDIYDLFNLRFRLHKQIYNHHTINQIEHMILDVFNLVDEYFNISKSIFDINEFIKINDNIIEQIYYSDIDNEKIKKAKTIIENIKLRKLYKIEEEISLDNKFLPKNIIDKYSNFTNDDYCYSFTIINYSKKNENPMNVIYLYNDNKKYLYDNSKIKICPNKFKEVILRIFKKI